MIIKVGEAGQVAIEDHDLFTGFHVEAQPGQTAERVASLLAGRDVTVYDGTGRLGAAHVVSIDHGVGDPTLVVLAKTFR